MFSRITINYKVQAVALIGVLGFLSYFLLSINSNYQYQELLENLNGSDLKILQLSNDVNLSLNNIETIVQGEYTDSNALQAESLLRDMRRDFKSLAKLDYLYQADVLKQAELSNQYASVLIDIFTGNISAEQGRQKQALLKEMSQELAHLRDEYRSKRVAIIDKKVQRSHSIGSESLLIGWVVGLLLTVLMLLLARYFAKGVTETLSYVSHIAGRISEGDWDVTVDSDTNDETADVLYSMEIMRLALKSRADEDARREEDQRRLFILSELSRKELGLTELCQAVMRQLSPMMNAQVGALYLVEERELEEIQSLKLVASYAFVHRKGLSERFDFGEGVIGQVALEKSQIVLSEVPSDYLTISSALGEGSPSFVVLTPLLFSNHLYGVMEFGFIHEPSVSELAFLMQAGESLAQFVESTKARENVRVMLAKTQEQAVKLEQQQEILQAANEDLEEQAMALTESEGRLMAQQEELRVTNEELEEQAKALKLSEERLQAQQEELRVTNEELEEHTRALEKQKKEMQLKNDALEESQRILQEKTKALELSGQYKSEFMSTMSHELRTPLNSILILSENLADNDGKNLTDKQVEHAGVINKAGNDLLALINDILDLAKVEEGKLELILDETSFDEWAKDLNLLFSPVAEKKGLEFAINLDEELGETFSTDVRRLNQILKNLLSNALKFTESGSVVVNVGPAPMDVQLVSTSYMPDELIAFAVKDSGLGIEKEKQGLIFEAFQQSDGAISRKFGGTGLGLTISSRLAKLLGGEITVSSEGLGTGSTFTVYIPKEAPDDIFSEEINMQLLSDQNSDVAEETDDLIDEEDSSVTSQQSIEKSDALLIVEDDPVFAATLSALAEDYGLGVLLANDGESAIQLAEQHNPQGIILDLMLPGIGGFDVLETLNNNPLTKDIPVHVMSGNEGGEKALTMGAIDFLKKPVSKKEITDLLAQFRKEGTSFKRLMVIEAAKEKGFEPLKELFGKQGVQIASVSNVKKAKALLESQPIDCIIFDLDFIQKAKGEKEALSALEKVHEEVKAKETPIIVCTGSDIGREQEASLRKYADRIILKSKASEERLISEASLFLHWLGSHGDKPGPVQAESRESLFEGKRVLVVDDDMRNVYSLTSELERRGMEVTAAESGLECLDVLQSETQTFDMILMDIMMPELDGFSTIEQIRADQRFKELPIIVLTAKSLKEDRARCLELGANDYLLKPIDVERLMALMRVWMT